MVYCASNNTDDYYAEIEKGRKPEELSLEEINTLSKKIGPLVQLSLTGGEPFLRKDFAEIASTLIRNTGAKYITIPTNASLTDRMVAFLQKVLPRHESHYFRLTFSIDGIGKAHDQHRSKVGSYENIQKSYATISPMREQYSNLVLDANTVFSAESEHQILDTVRHLDKQFDFDNLSITYVRGEIKDPSLKTYSEERYKEVNALLEGLKRKKENRFLYPVWRAVRDVSRQNLIDTVFHDRFVTPCVAGRKLIVISETGEVQPCEILGKSMGNVRDVDFDVNRLLKQNENRELVKWIKQTKCKCSFECALGANVVWNPSQIPRVLTSAVRNIGSN